MPPAPSRPLAFPDDQGTLLRSFESRSGRIIALTRLILATVFFVALWVDPYQPVRAGLAGYVILAGYIALAIALQVIAWRSWWWDHRLAWPSHVLDILVFLAAVYFTETTDDEFTSPFLAFFAYLMLAAIIRWGWRMAVATAVGATLLYLLAGLAMHSMAIELDTFRFGRRIVYMTVLSIIVIWLGHQRRGPRIESFAESPGAADVSLPPLNDALRYAMAQSGAQRGAIAWADHEEPQIELRVVGLGCGSGRLAPDDLPAETLFAGSARLFDCIKHRVLREGLAGNVVAARHAVDDPLARYCGIAEGLALPFEAVTGRGVALLADIPGASVDHLAVAREIAREISSGFDRHSSLALVREGAVTRMRDAVARDLHDTIAQSLAGAALRLEGLRAWIASGGDPDTEIQSIKTAIKGEQAQVRALIERLRHGESVLPEVAVKSTIGPLLRDLSTYWGIKAVFAPESGAVIVPGWLGHELRQLIREGVANAVRHGGARRIAVSLEKTGDVLNVTIADNGSGFDERAELRKPRSISERIAQLGGELVIESSAEGATVRFWLPLRAVR